MTRVVRSLSGTLALAAVLLVARPAAAQSEGKVEVGASLANVTFLLGHGGGTLFGVPSGAFSVINPGVYFSIMAGSRMAVEPQLGLIAISGGGGGGHAINAGVQIDGFLKGVKTSSPYVFGSAGLLSMSGSGTTPFTIGGGVGQRIRLGDRLTMRVSGHFVRLMANGGGGNMVYVGVWIGGMFGK